LTKLTARFELKLLFRDGNMSNTIGIAAKAALARRSELAGIKPDDIEPLSMHI